MAGLKVHTAETAYAVTQAEIKAWNKIDSSDDDSVVALIERAVHNWAKEYTNRTLTTVTYNCLLIQFMMLTYHFKKACMLALIEILALKISYCQKVLFQVLLILNLMMTQIQLPLLRVQIII